MTSRRSARVELARTLRKRRVEIEDSALARVCAIAEPTDAVDPEYVQGLRAAVAAALDYGLVCIELGEDRAPPIPDGLRAQARLAARSRVRLDTVFRRYLTGHALLSDAIMQATRTEALEDLAPQQIFRELATVFDRLVAAVTQEHRGEEQRLAQSSRHRRAKAVEHLLEGELVDRAALEYELQGPHLGLAARGNHARETVVELARHLDRRLLAVNRGEDVWAWLGGLTDPEEIKRILEHRPSEGSTLAVGEPGDGINGWRLTHQQAKAALPLALRMGVSWVRYSEVAILTALMHDDLLATSLRQLYLSPLSTDKQGGDAMRETLRAFFASGNNVTSAAAALGVNRNTVANRLRTYEEVIDHPLIACAVEIQAALRLADLEDREMSAK